VSQRDRALAEIRVRRAMMARSGRRRSTRALPRQLQPDAIRLSYFGALRAMVREASTRVLTALKPRFAEFVRDYAPTKRDSLHADAIDFNSFFDSIARDFFKEWGNTRFAQLARSIANRTASFQHQELGKQFKAAFGIDILKVEPWLLPRVQAFTTENVALVKSIPERYLGDVESQIIRGMRQGVRWEDLAGTIEQRTGVAESHAQLVARDQVGKFFGSLNEERQRDLGVDSFRWRTARDNRVRESHERLEGKVFRWDDPPPGRDGEPIIPGDEINCRCQAEPLLEDLIAELSEEAA
jgi:SPP1 gp7 family putative phage head morphogenesis protein